MHIKISDFSKWKHWSQRSELDRLEYPGVYGLAISSDNISNAPFSLIEEIVYFGMTNSINGLWGRLRQFDNTIKTGKHGLHGGAEKFRFKHPSYEELIENLYVAVNPIECDVKSNKFEDLHKMGEIAYFEYICLAEYAKKFGRLPEFNDKQKSPKKKKLG